MSLTDYQAELNSVIIGAGTAYEFDGPVTGLGVPAPRTSDLDLTTGGTVGGRDLPARRTIALPVSILGADAEEVMASVSDLVDAWAPTSTDTTLEIRLPGMGQVRWTGRPRGVDLDLTLLAFGAARARLVFDALDPAGEELDDP